MLRDLMDAAKWTRRARANCVRARNLGCRQSREYGAERGLEA